MQRRDTFSNVMMTYIQVTQTTKPYFHNPGLFYIIKTFSFALLFKTFHFLRVSFYPLFDKSNKLSHDINLREFEKKKSVRVRRLPSTCCGRRNLRAGGGGDNVSVAESTER